MTDPDHKTPPADSPPAQPATPAEARRRKRPGYRGYRADSADNAKPKVKYVTHGGVSALSREPIDSRTAMGKQYRQQLAALLAHVGEENLTHPRRELIDQGARSALLVRLAWAQVLRQGVVAKGRITPAFEALLKASREQREVLGLLGLARREKQAPTIDEYLAGKEQPQ